ncbi:hypothetical protein [Pedobacter miscanthi]|uniref:hypothetical protein n=1 Tax=Pedobacter miscanthi TaxID=2259170 RepID=UPI00292E214D|nr:hypothetical protein [Pedobacter miscanthi]
MLSYEEVCTELISKRVVPYADIFDFKDTPLEDLFEMFFTFCQTNLSEHCAEFDIQPARFVYTNDFDVNARAGYVDGYYIIKVNMGTIIETFKSFFANKNIFKQHKQTNEKYGSLEKLIEFPLGVVMYQAAIQFTYYHERAHLIQKPFQEFTSLEEHNQTGPSSHYSAFKHALEFDADVHAANLVPVHIIDFWKKLAKQDQTSENLSKLLSIGVSGILNYFMFMEKNNQNLYYRESSHPHPLIRSVYITDVIIHVAEINVDFKLDSSAILREAFNITESFCEHNGFPNFAAKFKSMFQQNFDGIKEYIDNMASEADHVSQLVRNRFPDSI